MAAVICGGNDLLLVHERAEGEDPIWMLPGGRVEHGESEIEALRREVREETGLVVVDVRAAFGVTITAELPDLTGTWRTLTFACSAQGDPAPADPDQFVTMAAWLPRSAAIERLRAVPWYHVEPLRRHLDDEALPGAEYRYRIIGRQGRAVIEDFSELPP